MLFMTSWANAESNMRNYLVEKYDTLYSIALNEVDNAEAWIEIQKYNNVPNPKLLVPGTTLKIPERLYQTQPVTALVLRIKGKATYISSLGEAVKELQKGDELTVGSIVETKPSSNVVLQFIDHSRLFISENSRVSLEVLQGKLQSKLAKTTIKIEAGSAESIVATQVKGAKYEVVTPEMRLAVRGTAFLVNVDPTTKTSSVMVMEGHVIASQKHLGNLNGVSLKQGAGFIAKENHLGTPVKLLPMPQLKALTDPKNISNWSATWALEKNKYKYRVQLFKGENYTSLHSDTIQEGQRIDFNNLEDGLYELKVRAIDNTEMEGLTASLQFEINAFPIPPIIQETHVKKNSNKKIVFSWQPEKEADYYHFQVSSAENFTSNVSKMEKIPGHVNQISLSLEPGEYFWHVASINETDGQGPFSQPKKVTVNK